MQRWTIPILMAVCLHAAAVRAADIAISASTSPLLVEIPLGGSGTFELTIENRGPTDVPFAQFLAYEFFWTPQRWTLVSETPGCSDFHAVPLSIFPLSGPGFEVTNLAAGESRTCRWLAKQAVDWTNDLVLGLRRVAPAGPDDDPTNDGISVVLGRPTDLSLAFETTSFEEANGEMSATVRMTIENHGGRTLAGAGASTCLDSMSLPFDVRYDVPDACLSEPRYMGAVCFFGAGPHLATGTLSPYGKAGCNVRLTAPNGLRLPLGMQFEIVEIDAAPEWVEDYDVNNDSAVMWLDVVDLFHRSSFERFEQ